MGAGSGGQVEVVGYCGRVVWSGGREVDGESWSGVRGRVVMVRKRWSGSG